MVVLLRLGGWYVEGSSLTFREASRECWLICLLWFMPCIVVLGIAFSPITKYFLTVRRVDNSVDYDSCSLQRLHRHFFFG